MRTAVLVLAILGDVFGGIGAVLAFAFGATLVGLSGGVAGQGAAGGAVLALLALIIGIVGTALATRRPKVAGTLLVSAAILGLVGTFSFALGALLYVIGGVMAFFVRPVGAVGADQTSSLEVGVNPRPRRLLLLPRITRRTGAIAAAIVVAVAVVGTFAASGNAEQRPVRSLIAALVQGDDLALAALLDPALRSGNASLDAERVLTIALGRSELSYLNAGWLRRLGPVTGTRMAFENVSYATTTNGATAATVHLRGLFSPSSENPIANLGLQALRGSFDADVAVANVGGTWFVTGAAVAPSPSTQASGSPVTLRPSTSAPTSPPLPTPPPPTARPTVTLVPPVIFAADFSAPSGLPSQGRSYSLTYQSGHALLNQCLGGLERCVWGVNRTGLVTIAAIAESRTGASCPACGDWGLVFRAGPANWVERGLADNATLAMISPSTGEYQLIVVTNLNEAVLAKAACTCVNKVGPNTIEVGLNGTQLYLAINGIEVAKVPDTQGTRGSGYGVFIRQNINDTTSLDLSYFAGK